MARRKRKRSARFQAYDDMRMAEWLDGRKGNIRLAGPQSKVFKPQKREAVVENTLDFMRRWRATPFENEGAVTHGIRSTLCLSGEDWQRANAEAVAVVGECLHRLGATRPDWSEGQREATVAPDSCAWCAGPIPEEMDAGDQVHRFCSSPCARAAIEKRNFARRHLTDTAYRAAMDVVRRARFDPIECAQCLKKFRPRDAGQKLCSLACREASKPGKARRLPSRACPTCGTKFRPLNGRRFCSKPCAILARSTFAVRKVCDCCSSEFTGGSGKAAYCSASCRDLTTRLRAGKVRRISPPVFDALWKGRRPSRTSVTAVLFEAA